MEKIKVNYNDNYSEFLSEFNTKSQSKIDWVNDKLLVINKAVESIPENSKLKQEFSYLTTLISNSNLDVSEKVIISLKQFTNTINNEDIDELNKNLNFLKIIIGLYIDIAKITSNESIAKEIINFGNSLEKKISL